MLERPIVSFKDIAAALRTSERQVLVWATRRVDPLRLCSYFGTPRILPSALLRWKQRHLGGEGLARIRGWHDIARRVDLSRIAAIRAEKAEADPLPVVHPKHGMVWAFESALDDWRDAHLWPYAVHRKLRRVTGSKT